ncbi:predicted protein [Sclerotinia sclerotiorum 1980 UF-70]|uniref:Uncharacterized protein n=1 Tax=Sclerotinia sclerotiorum (strain ATCC 18683 / 1980 / Ss-1) TaxID=665079 RepID=A7EDJ9_SCLS1|nr:predicted protein [Sclerotinia sclerotiorum 1980 UF-70]EDO00915.1 predicted protein [Sclerotinia sclerotiorum 1980 UF-70]
MRKFKYKNTLLREASPSAPLLNQQLERYSIGIKVPWSKPETMYPEIPAVCYEVCRLRSRGSALGSRGGL